MAVFRVERSKDYTVMSNHHLRNKELTLKAKGLLSQMLSLPEDWDYTLKGLAAINRESIDAIRTAVLELEQAGYIVRSRVRDERGCLRGCDYIVYERPQEKPPKPTWENPTLDNPTLVQPTLENPMLDSPTQENPTQLNKEIQNKEKPNTDLILSESDAVRKTVKENIELDLLCRNMPEATPMLQEIYELIIETIQSQSPTVRLGSNIFPAELANGELRHKRILAHHALHNVQTSLGMNRDQSYRWLQTQMRLPGDQVHIAKCGDYLCEQIIRICENATTSHK